MQNLWTIFFILNSKPHYSDLYIVYIVRKPFFWYKTVVKYFFNWQNGPFFNHFLVQHAKRMQIMHTKLYFFLLYHCKLYAWARNVSHKIIASTLISLFYKKFKINTQSPMKNLHFWYFRNISSVYNIFGTKSHLLSFKLTYINRNTLGF